MMFWGSKTDDVETQLREWLDSVMARLQPDRLKIQPGETVGLAVHRVFDLEEQRLQASNEEAGLRDMKLRALAQLRGQFPLDDETAAPAPEGEAANAAQGEADRPREATFELAMGGIDEAPLSRLADLIELWVRVVEGVGTEAKLSESLRREYHRIQAGITGSGESRELVAWFHGARDMVEAFRGYLRELGIES